MFLAKPLHCLDHDIAGRYTFTAAEADDEDEEDEDDEDDDEDEE